MAHISPESVRGTIRRSWRTTLARNSGWMFLGYGLRIFVQAGYFIIIARSLGPKEFGAFVGVTALVGILAPFAGIGFGSLLIKTVSRNKLLFQECWGNALAVTAVSGAALLGLTLGIARLVLPSTLPWTLIVLITLADLIAFRMVEIAGQAFQSVDQMRYAAALNLLPNVLRLLAAIWAFGLWRCASALGWGSFYLGSTAVASVIAIALTTWKLGFPWLRLSRIRKELREGFYFSASFSAQTIYNDIDKAMLARLATMDAAGIYAAAYRLIDVAFTPVRCVLYAAYANFFRLGQLGIESSYSYAKRLLPWVAACSLATFFVLIVAAPLVPVILGREYSRAVEALRWLALLPLLKSIHYFLADSLTGAGYQGLRTAAQIVTAAANVLLNLWLIPAYSWRGAAWSSLATDALLAVMMYAIIRSLRNELQGPQREAETRRVALLQTVAVGEPVNRG